MAAAKTPPWLIQTDVGADVPAFHKCVPVEPCMFQELLDHLGPKLERKVVVQEDSRPWSQAGHHPEAFGDWQQLQVTDVLTQSGTQHHH